MYAIKENNTWGYSIPAMMAGIYKSHPNNVLYLTEKFRLATKDIKHIMSMIDPEKRQRYDYDNINKLYIEYNHTKVDDKLMIEKIKTILSKKKLLIVLPGNSLIEYREKIMEYVIKNNAFVISVNFITDLVEVDNRMAFYGSSKRYKKSRGKEKEKNIIVVSNVENHSPSDMVVNYESLIERDNEDFDNTMIMLLNLLKRLGIDKFAIAGFDGYVKGGKNYFDDTLFEGNRFETKYDSITENMRRMLKNYVSTLDNQYCINFLTPSVYSELFEGTM